MNEYTLYLDESEISVDNYENVLFIIGGVIVENTYHENILNKSLNEIKGQLWDNEENSSDYVLHEMEVTMAHYGHFKKLKRKYHRIFAKNSKYKLLYKMMSELIDSSNVTTLCACINSNKLHSIYNKDMLNDRKSILMQIIIENYYHFLFENNSIGNICYEAMPENQNKIINKRYQYIRNTGTMFYPAKNINKGLANYISQKRMKI